MASSSSRCTTVPRHFDPSEVEDPSNPYPRPLLLVALPPLASQLPSSSEAGRNAVDVLAYGGDDGCVYLINPPRSSSSNDGGGGGAPSSSPRVVRKYDDEVRSVAVSPDGLRVAVGFDSGETRVYSYDDFVPPDGGGDSLGVHHPFIPASALRPHAERKDDDDGGFDDDDYGGFSQEDGGDAVEGEAEFDGPRADAPIRQLAFDPRSGSGGNGKKKVPYYLAVASESLSPLAVVDATSESTASSAKLLRDRSGDEYDGSGVRSVSYSIPPSGDGGSNVLLSTLSMDGVVVTWDVSSLADPELEWDVVHKDVLPAVKKEEICGDAGDRACRVAWGLARGEGGSDKGVAIVPGQADVQYKLCPLSKRGGGGGARSTEECGSSLGGAYRFVSNSEGRGHVDAISAVAVAGGKDGVGGSARIVTGGRDGKVLLWSVDFEEGTGSAAELEVGRAPYGPHGVPPVTGLVWDGEREEVHVAFADGCVCSVAAGGAAFEAGAAGGKKKEAEAAAAEDEDEEEEDDDATVELNETERPAASKGDKAPSLSDAEDDEDGASSSPLAKKKSVQFSPDSKEAAPAAPSAAGAAKKGASKFIDDQAEDGGDDDDDDAEIQYDDVTPSKAGKEEGAGGNDGEDKAADDDAAAGGGDDDDAMFDAHDDPVEFDAPANPAGATLRSRGSAFADAAPLQEPFAPSSTPFGEPRRILCWNHVGVATLRDDSAEVDDGLVDITFHETAGLVGGRRPITFTDNIGFVAGTLGEEGGFFASDLEDHGGGRDVFAAADEEEEELEDEFGGLGAVANAAKNAARRIREQKRKFKELKKGRGGSRGSKLYFHRFETFGRAADKDWISALPDGERALGCAVGTGWAGAITNRRFLRLFTTSGVQGPIIWLPGEPVTVVGRDRFAAVIYHRSVTPNLTDKTQLLGYTIFDGVTGATIANGEVSALSSGASLSWAGFTDKCALAVMDSDGVLSMLARYPASGGVSSSSGSWMPMLDTIGLRKDITDSFWPVEVHGGSLVCVHLRGGREYPDASRRPVTTTLKLRVPLAATLIAKAGQYEEGSVRAMFALNQEKVLNEYLVSQGELNEEDIEEEYHQKCKQVDKMTLSLFSNVVSAGKVERAFDLVQRLHSEKSFEVAIQMADRVGHRKLSDRIEEVKLQRYPPIEENDEPFDDSASFDERSSGSFADDEPVIATRQQRLEMSQRISPEGGVSTPRQQRQSHDTAEDEIGGEYSTDAESPPRESLKRKFEQDDAPVSKKRINPFAKKKLESPAKGIMTMRSPQKLSLSRSSTFSAKSRQKQRRGKQIV